MIIDLSVFRIQGGNIWSLCVLQGLLGTTQRFVAQQCRQQILVSLEQAV